MGEMLQRFKMGSHFKRLSDKAYRVKSCTGENYDLLKEKPNRWVLYNESGIVIDTNQSDIESATEFLAIYLWDNSI